MEQKNQRSGNLVPRASFPLTSGPVVKGNEALGTGNEIDEAGDSGASSLACPMFALAKVKEQSLSSNCIFNC